MMKIKKGYLHWRKIDGGYISFPLTLTVNFGQDENDADRN